MLLFTILTSGLIASCLGDDIPSPPARSPSCIHRNGYIKEDNQCDTYIECKNYEAFQRSCPDGLHYDASVAWPNYPCGYPMDVPCTGINQPAVPTPDCPHQFGYYPSPAASSQNCGHYRFCIGGKPLEMVCPSGLAFDPETSRCDWADHVTSCDVDAFLGFKCPPPTYDDNGDELVTNHKYGGSCYSFYSCQPGGHPRLLTCDAGQAFDDSIGRCEDANTVACAQDVISVPQSAQ